MPLITYNAHNLNGHWKKYLSGEITQKYTSGLHSELPWFFLGNNVLITTSSKINVQNFNRMCWHQSFKITLACWSLFYNTTVVKIT